MKPIRGRLASRHRAARTAAALGTAAASHARPTGAAATANKPAASLRLDFPLVTMYVRAPDVRLPQVGLDHAIQAIQVVHTARLLLPAADPGKRARVEMPP